jgi:hypothetical protein
VLDKKQNEVDSKLVIITQDLEKMKQETIKHNEEVNRKLAEYQNNTSKKEG